MGQNSYGKTQPHWIVPGLTGEVTPPAPDPVEVPEEEAEEQPPQLTPPDVPDADE